MAQIDILEEEVTFVPDMDADMTDEQEKARFAAEDLERIEEDAKREAEAYVEAVDGDGNEKASVEAAGTAFDFDEAELETAQAESWSRRGFGNVAAPLLHGVRRAARSSYNKEVACIVSLSKGALP